MVLSATRCAVPSRRMLVHLCYAVCGTELAYAGTRPSLALRGRVARYSPPLPPTPITYSTSYAYCLLYLLRILPTPPPTPIAYSLPLPTTTCYCLRRSHTLTCSLSRIARHCPILAHF
eukprot:2678065-Rhodomonas_salina.1